MESKDPCGIWTNEKVVMSFKIQRSGRISLVVEDRAMYSLSVVERVISDWSLLAQEIGHPQNVTT
jgi:hypothetical protein